MILLAIDTAAADCAVALLNVEQDRILASVSETIGKGHAERLMAMIDETLAEAGLEINSVGRIAVTVGPGSFTGIRVGVAAARGFGLALACPVIGITTLSALAATARPKWPGETLLAAFDAKREEVHAQVFRADGHAATGPMLVSFDEARAMARHHNARVVGSGALPLTGEAEASRPDIAVVARLAAHADPASHAPRPVYLRGPDARPQTGYALAHA